MKLIVVIGLTLVVLIGVLLVQPGSGQKQPEGNFQEVRTTILANSGTLLDVRTPQEYAAGHIEEAENLSLQDIQAGTAPNTPKDQPLYVYCQSGNRSAQATELLKSAGFQNVIDLGGIADVQASGGNITKP